MKVHLVDGTYELFRAFYGGRPRAAPDGREVGATQQLMRSMLVLLGEPDVSHVGLAFDTVIESFRNELFDGYKTGDGIDPDLKSQFPLVEEATEAMGLVCWRMIDFEADDAIAAAAHRFANDDRVDQVVICSPDKDLTQMVRGATVVSRDRMRNKVLDEDAVVEKFGVAPQSIPDWLGLVGDSADGIPGIPRWGAKGAASVLRRYEHIEAIPEKADDWDIKVRGAATLASNLSEMREEALLYKKLATLRTDVPLEESLEDMEWRGANRETLTAFCTSIGMREDFVNDFPRFR
ncbi:MAG: 5'-3' exonuclease H3TH domain-containing protein [Polyangiaceae bacterium]